MTAPSRWTAADLRALKACKEQTEQFAAAYPDGATVDDVPALTAAGLDVEWLAKHVLPRDDWQAYLAARDAHWQAYEAACAPHWQAYLAACDAHRQAYEAACAPHRQAYEAACAALLADALRSIIPPTQRSPEP